MSLLSPLRVVLSYDPALMFFWDPPINPNTMYNALFKYFSISEGKVQAAIHQITDDSSRRSSTECLLRKKITGSVALKNTIENSCLRNTTENLHQRSSIGDLPPWLQVMDGMIKDISGCLHFIKNNCHLHCWSCCHFLVKNQLLCRFLAIKTLL